MAKKIQMMSHDKEWQVIDGVETLVPVEQFDIDPITDSSCVKIEGFRTLEETLNEKNMFTPEVNATKVMDKVGGEYHQNVVDGAYEEAILYGNTQVNLCEEDTSVALQIPTTFTSFNNGELQINNKENQVVAPLIKGVTMVNLAQTNSASITSGNATVIRNVKGNTVYTLSFTFTTKNTNSGVTVQCYDGNGTFIENTIHKTGLGDAVKFTFTTHANTAKVHICNNVAYGGETIQLDEIMLIEGDQTALDIPYFKGMKSVELVRPLTNLFANDTPTAHSFTNVTNNNGQVTATSQSSATWTYACFNITFKSNTSYIVMWDSLSYTQTGNTNQTIAICYGNDIIANIDNNFTNKRSIIFNTGDRNPSDINLRIHATTKNTETATTTVKGLRVFEYDDYLRSVDLQSIGWFSGTKNVAVEPIKTCSKNLYPYGDVSFTPTSAGWFDAKGNGNMYGDIAQKSKSRFLLKKGTYYLSMGEGTNISSVQLINDKEEMLPYTPLVLEQDTYLTIRVNASQANVATTLTNIQIERGETATDYVAHDSRYYEPNGQNAVVLRSLPDGVCDTFNLQTGEYIQRIGEAILDGDEDIVKGIDDTDYVNTIEFYINRVVNAGSNKNSICDSYIYKYKNEDTEHFYTDNKRVVVFIQKTKLSSQDVDGFKQYLQQNPITVQYQLTTPITTIIPRTIKRNNNGTVSTVDFKTYTNKESLVLPSNPSYLTINSMTSIKPVVEPITYIDFKTRLKTNTSYSIIMDKDSANKTINLGGTSKTYADKMLVRTPSINLEQNLRISGSGSIQNIMVIEGDVLDKELPYFNGMCNVKMPIIRNCGKNLFDGNWESGKYNSHDGSKVDADGDLRNVNPIFVKPNTRYTFTNNGVLRKTNIWELDKNMKFKKYTYASSMLATSPETYFINICGANNDRDKFQIVESKIATPYEPYRGNDICIVQGEIGLSQDMFEVGAVLYGRYELGAKYEIMKDNSYNYRTRLKELISIKPDTVYNINISNDKYKIVLHYFDASGGSIQKETDWIGESCSIKTPTDAYKVNILLSYKNDFEVILNSFDFNAYQILELDSTVQLRSLPNGVKDELNLLTGEYIQRVGEVVFDGSEDEGWHMEDVNVVNHLCFDTVYAGVLETNPLYTNFRISDKFDSISHEEYLSDSVEGIRYFSIPAISISRSKLNEPNVTGFKQYLSQNPLTVQYELAEPIISYPRIVSNTQEREVGVKLPNGVCDTYNPSTGITVKRVGKVVLDGSENWKEGGLSNDTYYEGWLPNSPFAKTMKPVTDISFINGNFVIMFVADGAIPHFNLLNSLIHGGMNIKNTSNPSDPGATSFVIQKSKMTTPTLDGFKQYLASNPITVWYELKNPIVTTDIVLPNGVRDEYNPITGLYTKRVGYIEFDGSEDWHEPFAVPTSGAVDMYNIWTEQPLNNAKPAPASERIAGVCDSLKFKNSALDLTNEEFYFISPSGRFNMNLSRSKLSEPTEQALKIYLSQNPIKLWYELQTPITYQLTPYFGLPMPYAYKDGYLIMDSAYEGQTLPPEIKYKLLANRTGQITQNNIKLQNHTSKLSNLEAMLVEATLQSMYEREMMAFNLEMVNINLINLEE